MQPNSTILAFVHIEKCGGTTVIDALRRTYVLNHCDVIPRDASAMLFDPRDLSHLLRLRPQLSSFAGHSVRLHSNLEEAGRCIEYYTCLREPVERYLSEYYYFVEHLGVEIEFKNWLEREDRHNFQTKAIAGTADVQRAQNLLDSRFTLVGLLEQSHDFMSRLSHLCFQRTGKNLANSRGVLNARAKRTRRQNVGKLLEQYASEIKAANRLDLELYRHAVEVTVPNKAKSFAEASSLTPQAELTKARPRGAFADMLSLGIYRVYRNLIYKPYVGRWPGPHTLPAYKVPNPNRLDSADKTSNTQSKAA